MEQVTMKLELLRILQVLFQFNPDNPWGMYYYNPHFADKEIKVLRST